MEIKYNINDTVYVPAIVKGISIGLNNRILYELDIKECNNWVKVDETRLVKSIKEKKNGK